MKLNTKSTMRRLAIIGALVMTIGLGAASAASASTTGPVWTQSGTHLPFGTAVSYSAGSVSGLNLKWKQSGLQFWVQCNALSANGSVEDSASGLAGTLKSSSATFKGCRVVQVGGSTAENNTTCSVPNEIPLQIASGEATSAPYSSGGLKLNNIEIAFSISKCPAHAYEGWDWIFTGSPTGNEGLGAWPGEILYPEGTPLTVNLGGTGAEAEFGINIQGAGFTPIKLGEEEIAEPHNPGHHYWYRGGAQRKGEGAQTLIAAGSPLPIKGSGDTLSIEGTLSGIETQVSCSGGTTAGTVENPAGGGDGTANVSFALTGCTVPVPAGKGCYVEGGGFSTGTLPGTLQKAEAFAPMALRGINGGGELIATIPIRGCSAPALNSNFPVTGTLLVSPYLSLSTPGSWTITKSQTKSSKLFRVGGQIASASGLLMAETSGGEAVTWTE